MRMIASMRMIREGPETLAAMAYKYPSVTASSIRRTRLSFAEKFLICCFAVPCEEYNINPGGGGLRSQESFILHSALTTIRTPLPRMRCRIAVLSLRRPRRSRWHRRRPPPFGPRAMLRPTKAASHAGRHLLGLQYVLDHPMVNYQNSESA